MAVGGFVWCAPCDAADLLVGGSLTATTDYVFRGISQNRGQPAVQADVHLRSSGGWTVGAWASQVSLLPDSHTMELNLYGSWRWPLSEQFSAETGVVYYAFLDDPRPAAYDYLELMASLTWRDALTLGLSVAPRTNLFSVGNGLARNRHTVTVELAGQHEIGAGWTGNAGIGYFTAPGLITSYTYGSLGLARGWGRLRAELSYIHAQHTRHRPSLPGQTGGPWVATLSWHF